MALGFLALVFGLCAAGLLLPDREYSPQENRYLATAPAPSLQAIRSAAYMSGVEAYITDQFPARDHWISFKALCQRLSGQKENNGVFFAADAYLIGKPLDVDTDILKRNLASVLALRSAGYDVALLVSPMAAEILREKLPEYGYTAAHAEITETLRREAPDIFVDPTPGLRQASAVGMQVFFRTDHHWTMAGAYQAYTVYMEWLGEKATPWDSFGNRVAATDFYGTLWSKNSLPGIAPDSIVVYEPQGKEIGFAPGYEVEFFDGGDVWKTSALYQPDYLTQKDKYAYFLGQNRPLVVIRRTDSMTNGAVGTDNESTSAARNEALTRTSTETISAAASGQGFAEKQKLLILKDSYAHCFAPFLLPHFDELHLMDLRYWRQDPIAYMEEQGIRQVLFLYNADSFAGERSISQVGAYLSARG